MLQEVYLHVYTTPKKNEQKDIFLDVTTGNKNTRLLIYMHKKKKNTRDNKNDICFCLKYYENYFRLGFSNTEIYPATNN